MDLSNLQGEDMVNKMVITLLLNSYLSALMERMRFYIYVGWTGRCKTSSTFKDITSSADITSTFSRVAHALSASVTRRHERSL